VVQSAICLADREPVAPAASAPVAEICDDLLKLFGSVSDGRSGQGRNHPVAAVAAENPVTLCDLGIFAGRAVEPVSLQHPDIRAYCGRMRASSGRVLLQRPVRPMGVVIDIFAQDQLQVPFAGDQQPGPGTHDGRWRSSAWTVLEWLI
jgi:hypothetical protein